LIDEYFDRFKPFCFFRTDPVFTCSKLIKLDQKSRLFDILVAFLAVFDHVPTLTYKHCVPLEIKISCKPHNWGHSVHNKAIKIAEICTAVCAFIIIGWIAWANNLWPFYPRTLKWLPGNLKKLLFKSCTLMNLQT
jgi:hypothetical protein